ncbi:MULTISPECIES: sirohydrochlorin chelatase [unclassified Pseudonocardia]|uniref:sirohydrochlorin chelatase n=1 Tax=unclassified Pseudonocardia TaxID=2619320 RepID=UPI0001FFF1C3|nr:MULTISPECIES: sirohydrochlorin chelatase [unclassified Pseudonocardia]ALE74885.1 cobalamin biosynthesis protein CbiX [Pseudonocardia sp. EC080625-04]ALL74220.1 cobalamin biosynthesis protein CbiX [Pseudonocardia sp. EC080610-09]ALL81243.1 cobalamin biosynthesis protein CbiX [Pseudonocardia sp. EC080619-01]OLM16616.1 Sirohydrochlorin ferrochelatase [Pseudonocardia sp. Ae707_Ps1]
MSRTGTTPPLLLVAHGSRSDAADAVVRSLASAVAEHGPQVEICYVDVRGPKVVDAVLALQDRGYDGAVVVPAFLASGYHVRVDLPAQLAEAGADPARFPTTPALGPDPLLASAALHRLRDAGYRDGDAVVLAAAGSSDPSAVAEVRAAAGMLSALVGRRVRTGFAATGTPTVSALVEGLHAAGEERVAVASWLLAPGVFQNRLLESGADVVGGPLGVHDDVVRAVLTRYSAGLATIARAA